MSDRDSALIFHSPLVQVFDVSCHMPQSGYGGDEWCRIAQIMVPRRGVFMLRHQGALIAADPNTAVMFGVGDTYQVRHPVDGGDQCTVLVFRPEVLEDALGSVKARHGTIRAATQLRMHVLTYTMATGIADRLEAEEGAVSVLNALTTDFSSSLSPTSHRVSAVQQQRVQEVRALLASQPSESWHLDSIARTVYCSPYHLARQFREVTGESIARYVLRLRLARALDYLTQGQTDLARLAVELGFAHHSHFSARFRSVFGTTPAAVRHTLTQRRLQKMSKIVTVKLRTQR